MSNFTLTEFLIEAKVELNFSSEVFFQDVCNKSLISIWLQCAEALQY